MKSLAETENDLLIKYMNFNQLVPRFSQSISDGKRIGAKYFFSRHFIAINPKMFPQNIFKKFQRDFQNFLKHFKRENILDLNLFEYKRMAVPCLHLY